jgi:hypothetical protein
MSPVTSNKRLNRPLRAYRRFSRTFMSYKRTENQQLIPIHIYIGDGLPSKQERS